MCGIVAQIARTPVGFQYSDRTIMQNLLLLDTFRGLDSTGAFMVEAGKNNIQYVKVASHPYHLFATDLWDKMASKMVQTGRIMVGHNRHATQGAVSSANAHPFHENNIVLVHNGTLRGGHRGLADVAVDSHAIAHAFNEQGARNILPTLEGAFALVWWDIEAKRLFAIRNTERPLSIVVTAEVLYLASEPWMVNAAAGREGRKVLEVLDILPGNLYEFGPKDGSYSFTPVELLKTTTTTTTTTTGVQMSKKVGGALTVVKTTPPQQVETKSPDVDEETVLPKIDESVAVNPDYQRGHDVLVKVYEAKRSPNGSFFIMRGKSMEPFKPQIDVIVHAPATMVTDTELAKWVDGPVVGKIKAYTTTVNGGPTMYVRAARVDTLRKVWNGHTSEHEWLHVLCDGKCVDCGTKVFEDTDSEFTTVARTKDNGLKITCAECTGDKLIPGVIKNEFNERRTATLQARITEREKLANLNDGNVGEVGTPTIH